MNRKTQLCVIVVLLLGMIGGIGVTAYPMISAIYSARVRSEIYTQFEEEIQETDVSVLDADRYAAYLYNASFSSGGLDPLTPTENGYYELLNVSGSSIMGYVHIPKIHVDLPIYHGIGEDALSRGAGHLPQSSLPVGGESTHSVISAHSGMASSPMFSDLPLMEEGDQFQIEVLGERLTYEIDRIQIVLPVAIDSIQIENGKDLCTLVTCTPYGINTHRLLVRGRRVETVQAETKSAEMIADLQPVSNESVWMDAYVHSVVVGVLLGIVGLLIFTIMFLLWRQRNA